MRPGNVTVTVLALALAGCAPAKDNFSDSGMGYAPISAAAAADWSQAQTIDVTLADFEFQPAQMTFQSGQPYRLHVENAGKNTHFFVSAGFFKSIAVDKLVQSGGSVDHPYLREIALAPGESKELLFVAVTKGTYDLSCTAPFHAAMGMVGKITIS